VAITRGVLHVTTEVGPPFLEQDGNGVASSGTQFQARR